MRDLIGVASVLLGAFAVIAMIQPLIIPVVVPNTGSITIGLALAAILSGIMARSRGSGLGTLGAILGLVPIVVFAIVLILMAAVNRA